MQSDNAVVDREDSPRSENGPPWESTVRVGKRYKERTEEVKDLLRDFQSLCSGRLGSTSGTKPRIELREGSKLVYQPPYSAGHRKREFEKYEVTRMLADGVLEPSNAE